MPANQSSEATVRVLLVDDLKDNLLALEGLLKREGVEIFKARSGTEALEFLLRFEFAVALIDVQMPGMSGFELAEFMRGSKRTRDIPIIFVTATAGDQSFSFKGYESGAVDFLLKPLDTHAVRSKVSVFTALYRQKCELKAQIVTITRLHEELSFTKTQAENANASKSMFLANMSHEIRTPLSAILGFAELLADPIQPRAEALDCSSGIQRNVEHLTELIDQILDLAKVEAGKLDLDIVRFALLPALGEIFTYLQDRAKAASLSFGVSFVGEIPQTIDGCPMRLRQILLNVIGNALKFTQQGGVNVVIQMAPKVTGASSGTLCFEVKDTGSGLSSEQQLRLFRPFSQADSSVTRKYGGTGLGLVLARRLAEALGGSVELTESSPGRGSTFAVGIGTGPLTAATMLRGVKTADLAERPEQARDLFVAGDRLKGLRILLVEDGLDIQALMRRFLEASGATVTLAVNGAEAVAMASAAEFNLVLMDMQMPVLDGYEATRELLGRGCTTPIVALTAHAMRSERDACLAAGCVECVSKPIRANALVNVVEKFARRRVSSSFSPATQVGFHSD